MSTKGAWLQRFMGADGPLKSTQLRPSSIINPKWVGQSPSPKKDNEKITHPLEVDDIGLKSVLPLSTKCASTLAQSSLESHVIFAGGSTSTGITWETPPHWRMTTSVPMPPLYLHRSSRRWMSAMTSGSWT
jgi:hypothetical protein